MKANIEEALAGLSQYLENIRALVAWRDLEEAERRTRGPDWFCPATSTERQLRIEVGMFLKSYFDIQDALKGLPPEMKEPIQKRLEEIYQKFRVLPLPEGLVAG